jgi:hypothetical protein
VVQRRRRILAQTVGDLLVGQRVVQAQAEDAQAQRMGHRLELGRGGVATLCARCLPLRH